MKSLFMPGKNAIRVGRLFGIDVALDFNWFLVFFVFSTVFSNQFREVFPSRMGATVFGVIASLSLFASVLAHEFGHALTARLFGIKTQKIVLHLFGGVAYLESEMRRPRDEFFVAIAGPAVSLVLGGAFLGLMFLMGANTAAFQLVMIVAMVNLALGIFNCVPGFPLDGGRVLRSIIWAATGRYLLATRIASWCGMGVGILISLYGVLYTIFQPLGADVIAAGIIKVLLGVFLIHLARLSVKQAEFIDAFRGVKVSDVMQPIRAVVPHDLALSDVYERYFRVSSLESLPVVDGQRLLGSIAREDVQAVPLRQWDWVTAREAARPYDEAQVIDAGADAITALERLARLDRFSLPVFAGRRLMGSVTHADLGRVIARRRDGSGGPFSAGGAARPGTPSHTHRSRTAGTAAAPGN